MPFVNVSGKRLEFERWGDDASKKPTLVFLHEGLGSLSMWRDFPEQLARDTGCSALAYSRAGYGNSDDAVRPRSVDFMHEEASVLPEFLEKVQVQEVLLIGHSDGGSIALIYSAKPVVPVRALVLEAPHVFVEETTVESIAASTEEYLYGNLKSRLAKYHPRTDETFLGWSDVWLRPEFLSWNIEEFLPQINIPVLVIQGEEDRFGTTRQVEAIQKGCAGPVETLLIPKCGHRPHREKPEETLQRMVNFIERNTDG